MAVLRAQVRLASDSNDPADIVTNTWHFGTGVGDPVAGDFVDIETNLETFYAAFQSYLSSTLATTGHELRIYDLGDVQPRVPVYTSAFSCTPSGNDSLPREVALCCSLRGEYVSGVNPQRKRGRVYLGPFTSAANSATRPAAALVSAVATAADTLITAMQQGSLPYIGVWSPTTGELVPVTSGWVDNEWDIVRRRGTRPSSRTVFSV